MSNALESWMYDDPAKAVERKELQEGYAKKKQMQQVRDKSRKQAERELLLERLLRNARR